MNPPPGTWPSAAAVAVVRTREQVQPDPLRWKVVDRLAVVGRRHARHRHELRGSPSLPGPHAVIFLFRQPVTGGHDEIRIATRMFLDGDDVADLPSVLTTLTDRVTDYRTARVSHPLPFLVDRAERMTRECRYLGAGTSTLGPVRADGDQAWQGLALLVDDTRLVLRATLRPHDPLGGPAGIDVRSTHTLDTSALSPLDRARTWRYASPDLEGHDPDIQAPFDALHRLHALIAHTEQRHRRQARSRFS